jgi:CRISPR system Cascade subunit CasE
MYLSRVRIDPKALINFKLIKVFQGNIYAAHQLIWRLFQEQPDKDRSFIFRQEYEKEQLSTSDARQGIPIFYVVSLYKPSSIMNELIVEAKEYNPKLSPGINLDFKIRVNPVIARSIPGKKNSSKHDVLMNAKITAKEQGISDKNRIRTIMNEAVINWFSKKGEKSGFRLSDKSLPEVSAYLQHVIKKRGTDIHFSSVDLTGSLEVTDPELFIDTLSKGIGHSRSFGCGMMMIKRI